MKKVVAILLVVCLFLGACAGCGDRSDPGSVPQESPSSSLEVIDSPSIPSEANGDTAPEPEIADDPPTIPQEENTPSGSSQEPENLPEENTLYFSLGPDGEVKALRAGDALGQWTLESYEAQWDIEGRDIPLVDEAVFVASTDAPIEIHCTVSLNPMSSDRNYWFTVAEEDLDKMPVMKGDARDVWFSGNNSSALDALADIDISETRSCRVAVSKYTFVCLPMMASNGADIVWIELK